MDNRFYKVNPIETINVGDLIMLDIETGKVTISKAESSEQFDVNGNLILGVCETSDNETKLPELMDCGTSKIDEETMLLDCGNSKQDITEVIECEDSVINPRTYITTSSTGIVELEFDGRGKVHLGEKVIMSWEPNKVTGNEFLGRSKTHNRTIGKIVGRNGSKLQVLLDIE